jgi:hypothetical protein
MKPWIFFLSIISFNTIAQSNPAMPGIWNAGVGGQFYPLFEKDSIYFGKIRMQKELVLVNLYPGFAVVKGEYSFLNLSNEDIRMHVGFPVNGTYASAEVDNVMFNDLYGFRAFANQRPVKAYRLSDSGEVQSVRLIGDSSSFNEVTNWYVWEQDFPRGQPVTLTVYFITQNNLARFKRNFQSRDGNAFGYVLESGRAWAGNIGIGQILVKLNEGLSMNNVQGILPGKGIIGDLTHIQYSFNNLEPEPEHNLLVWYQGAPPDFKFDKRVLPAADTLFKMMDAFPLNEFNSESFTVLERNNFSLSPAGMTLSGLIYFLMFTLPWIILGGFIIFLVRGKKKKTENLSV